MTDPYIYDAEAVDVQSAAPGPPVDPPTHRRTFAAVVSRPADLRPVVPASLRTPNQRRQLRRWAVRYTGHTVAYHTTRAPKYAAKVAWYAPVGAGRTVWRLTRWCFDAENWSLRQHAANRGDADAYLKLVAASDRHVGRRLFAVAAGTLALAVAAAVLVLAAPLWAQWTAAAGAVLALAYLGRPADRPIIDRVQVGQPYRRLTAELTRAALLATGYGKAPEDYTFPREIARDGDGWSALVDLPHGVTAAMVMDRQDRIAASPALRLPVDQVWLRPGKHAGQIDLWVADAPISQTRQPAWPLLRAGRADLFAPIPFATDERGAPVLLTLMFTNAIIGAIPRMGKTFVLRLLLLAACLDPRVRIGAADLKGTGDLAPLRPVATWYVVGDDDDDMDTLMAALRDLQAEMRRRTKVLRNLPRDVVPESKITPGLAGNAALDFGPVVFGIDECQILFGDDQHKVEAERLVTDLIRRGPAVGIIILLATQRPDAKSLPTGISANAGTRFCLRVMGQVENDIVLGTSMWRNGYRAAQFTDQDKGMGWLVGAATTPIVARAYYVDAVHADRVVARAVELRGGPTRAEHSGPVRAPSYNLLADLRAVWPESETALWRETALELLAALRPDVYGGWDADTFGAAVRAAGLKTVSVHRKVAGKGTTLAGIRLDALTKAIDKKAIK